MTFRNAQDRSRSTGFMAGRDPLATADGGVHRTNV